PRAALAAAIDDPATIDLGLASLAEIFATAPGDLEARLVEARAIDWGKDPFARGAYSYAALGTRAAQAALTRLDDGAVYFCGEAVHAGPDIGTVEAALASGRDTARALLVGAATAG